MAAFVVHVPFSCSASGSLNDMPSPLDVFEGFDGDLAS